MSATVDDPVVEDQPKPYIELHGQVEEGGSTEGSMMVRWCFDPNGELAKELVRRGATNPFALISVRPYRIDEAGKKQYQRETKRYLVPLTREMELVSFSKSGYNSVTITVVYGPNGEGKHYLSGIFLQTYGTSYENSLFDYYKDNPLITGRHWHGYDRGPDDEAFVVAVSDEITVDVEEGVFAEPPQWKVDYSYKFWRNKAFDECHMRKRMWFFGYWFLPFFFFFGYTFRVLQVVFGAWIGLNDIRLNSFVHPFTQRAIDVTDHSSYSIWFRRPEYKGSDWTTSQPWWRMVLNPITPVLLAVILFVISSWHITRGENIEPLIGWSWWQCLAVAVAIHLAVVLVPLLFIGIFMLFSAVVGLFTGSSMSAKLSARWSKYRSNSRAARNERQKIKKEQDIRQLERELSQMACTKAGMAVSVSALPRNKQTIPLRIKKTKQKVCRPFAKS